MMKHCLSLSVALTIVFAASAAWAQPGRPGGFGQGGFGQGGFGGGGGGVTQLLQNEDVRKELELVDTQIEKLRALAEEGGRGLRDLFQGGGNLRDLSDEERRERFAQMRTQVEERTAELQKKVDEVLLPHQRERLSQIRLQMSMQFGGSTGALRNREVSEALGITEEQLTQAREKAAAAQTELNEKIAKLRQESQDAVLQAVLTPDQFAKFKKMVGEPFQLSTPAGGGRGGFQPGQPGAQGRQPGARGAQGRQRGGNNNSN